MPFATSVMELGHLASMCFSSQEANLVPSVSRARPLSGDDKGGWASCRFSSVEVVALGQGYTAWARLVPVVPSRPRAPVVRGWLTDPGKDTV